MLNLYTLPQSIITTKKDYRKHGRAQAVDTSRSYNSREKGGQLMVDNKLLPRDLYYPPVNACMPRGYHSQEVPRDRK